MKTSTTRLRGALAAVVALVLAAVLVPVEALAATIALEEDATHEVTLKGSESVSFTFTPTESGVYYLDFGDYYWLVSTEVSDADGNELTELSTTDYLCVSHYVLEAGQTYTFDLSLYDEDIDEEATLEFTLVQDDVTDVTDSGTVTWSVNGLVDLLYPGEFSYYAYTAPVSGTYTLTLSAEYTNEEGGWLWAYLSASSAGETAYADELGLYGAGASASESIEVELEAGETVFVCLEAYSIIDEASADLTLTVTCDEFAPVWRVYNPYSGEHHFTVDANEYATLVALGWTGEGVAWYAPTSSSTPVYRLYNQWTGDHHYTTDANERATLVALGWTDEGIGWYSAGADDEGAVAVYRLYNPYASAFYHHYTTDANENSTLASLGWEKEGTGWYGF